MEKIDTISIVIGGLPSVGKTAITLQFTRNIFPIDYDPSTRGTFQRYLTIGGKNVLVKITDAGYEFGNGREVFYQYIRSRDGKKVNFVKYCRRKGKKSLGVSIETITYSMVYLFLLFS